MRGFTLVELLVTMAIFISVITIATGALYSAQAVNPVVY
jgi:prepilin-type N-terminal cleavage/methylation domain-containing protein